MNKYLLSFAQKIGMDKSIAYTSGARIIQGIAGIGSVFFITSFLSDVEQGFFFTFGSIVALQIFFELGLTGIMTQYVAHEVSHLSLNQNLEYEGESVYKSRLAYLVRFCVKWYSILACIVFVFLIIVGFVYFTRFGDAQSTDIEWRKPWVVICLATSIQLFISAFSSILSGLGFVKEISKISFYQQIITSLTLWVGLVAGGKLYVAGIAYLASSMVWLLITYRLNLLKILLLFLKVTITDSISYIKEIFPYQWKIALSWVSGYFVFQLFNPVLFAAEGAIVAGQMGMTLSAINAVQALSMSWMSTKIPLYSKLIALKDYIQLDKIFKHTLYHMIFVSVLCMMAFFSCVVFLRGFDITINDVHISDRFLLYIPILFLLSASLANHFVGAWATYMRCHKQEPLVLQSVVVSILVMTSTFLFGRYFGVIGVTLGYSIITVFVSLPWTYFIFKSKKIEWHE